MPFYCFPRPFNKAIGRLRMHLMHSTERSARYPRRYQFALIRVIPVAVPHREAWNAGRSLTLTTFVEHRLRREGQRWTVAVGSRPDPTLFVPGAIVWPCSLR